MIRTHFIAVVALWAFGSLGALDAAAQPFDWQPQPEKATLMVVSSHPDDEGIFFGGLLPYYAQVRSFDTVHVSMTSGDYLAENGPPGWAREQELKAADWTYGLRNEPLFGRFRDYPTSTLDQTFEVWADGQLGGGDANEGRLAAAMYVATQIRTYRPEVIATHDFDGEYGHFNHRATGLSVAYGYDLASDPSVEIDGLPAWQPKKLYVHQSEANGLGTGGESFTNWLFHDYWEDTSIDTDQDGVPDKSPRQVGNDGLDQHVSQGQPDVSTVYRTGENFDGHHSEWWGLYRSTVGPDTVSPRFTAAGREYLNWARGDLFEHVFDPNIYSADVNQDGVVLGDGTGPAESDDVTAFVLGWGSTGHVTDLDRLTHGDINLDGRTNLTDWGLLRTLHPYNAGLDLAKLLPDTAGVPEPAALVLLLACPLLAGARRGDKR